MTAVQRDDSWLTTANSDQIVTAFEAGELDTLLGRPTTAQAGGA